MRYGSVCSGIEAATVAWHHLGWEPAFFSEIEAFPCAALAHHYPTVPNYGDMTKFKEWPDATIDVLVGGTPCQSFSVAGLRQGLADPRGNLMLTYLAIAKRYRPDWLVWENVPGVLSSNGGRDFGSFLGGLGQLGYGFAYRVLDAQYFGVAQRRRRVFVVGCLGDWRRAAAVLFERESLSGHPAPSREARQGAARGVGGGPADGSISGAVTRKWAKGSGGPAGDECYNMVAQPVAHALRGEGFDASEDGTGRGTPLVPVAFRETADCLTSAYGTKWNGNASADNGSLFAAQPVAFAQNTRDEVRLMNGDGSIVGALAAEPGMKQTCYVAQPVAGSHWDSPANPHPTLNQSHNTGGIAASDQELFSQRGSGLVAQPVAFEPGSIARNAGPAGESDLAPTLRREMGDNQPAVRIAMQVRRLTPVECERLQGFPDGYTAILWRKKAAEECPDGPRYKALGNSMAVPVMRWIGERIAMVAETPTPIALRLQRQA